MAWPNLATSFSAEMVDQTGASNFGFSHTGSGNKLVVLLGGFVFPTTVMNNVTGVTYGGNALTQVVSVSDESQLACQTQLWEYTGTISGTQTITVSYNFGPNNVQMFAVAASFDGAATATAYGINSGISPCNVTVVDTQSGDYVVSFLSLAETFAAPTTVSSGTLIGEAENINGGTGDFSGQYQVATGASTVCSWTNDNVGAEPYSAIAIRVRSASGGGGGGGGLALMGQVMV